MIISIVLIMGHGKKKSLKTTVFEESFWGLNMLSPNSSELTRLDQLNLEILVRKFFKKSSNFKFNADSLIY